MVSSRLTPIIKCTHCNNVTNIVIQTPTEQLLSFMEIIPTPASPASNCTDNTNNNLNHAILKLKTLAIQPDNDVFFKKTIICSKCAKYMATEFSYHNMDEPGMNAVISAIQEASKKTNIEILKGQNLYEELLKQIKENENKMLYFVFPYEDITPILKLNEIAENQNINLIIENLVSPSEESSPFTNNSGTSTSSTPPQPSPKTPRTQYLTKLKTQDINEENKKKEQNSAQHLFVSIKI
ncbi:hypothetical protein BCR32DRAFT_325757 [Anaeromyces robustus]|uniref:Uncharacterized protein n=1 Tax=Anaeromyces robustus TaxID=1754192 RepID=A0A1Y1XH61_9FUNG|nr:hypothetical protein BCR32DRAFT_325757 [Anaeromyces robustus]|eukprot:ORX84736.1 hypothetical protein BCR32DRAFT_325757 [Anaeromyces robustus]